MRLSVASAVRPVLAVLPTVALTLVGCLGGGDGGTADAGPASVQPDAGQRGRPAGTPCSSTGLEGCDGVNVTFCDPETSTWSPYEACGVGTLGCREGVGDSGDPVAGCVLDDGSGGGGSGGNEPLPVSEACGGLCPRADATSLVYSYNCTGATPGQGQVTYQATRDTSCSMNADFGGMDFGPLVDPNGMAPNIGEGGETFTFKWLGQPTLPASLGAGQRCDDLSTLDRYETAHPHLSLPLNLTFDGEAGWWWFSNDHPGLASVSCSADLCTECAYSDPNSRQYHGAWGGSFTCQFTAKLSLSDPEAETSCLVTGGFTAGGCKDTGNFDLCGG